MGAFATGCLIVSLAFAIWGWKFRRPIGWVAPSDTLFIMSVILVGVPPLINPHATSALFPTFTYNDTDVVRTLFGISIMFLVFGFVWFFRPRLKINVIGDQRGDTRGRGFVLLVFVATLLMGMALLAVPSFLKFKVDVLRFFSHSLSELDYQFVRRIAYSDDTFLIGFIGRLRYSVFPFLFVLSIIYVLEASNAVLFALCSALLFLLLPASVSKLPIAIFLGYAVIIFKVSRGRDELFLLRKFLRVLLLSIAGVIALLTLAYTFQYSSLVRSIGDIGDLVNLAMFRLFFATYTGLVQTFVVYPHVYDFTYLADSSVVSYITGSILRDVSVEVPTFFLGWEGAQLTTSPTIFIGAAYAEFGYLGIIFVSIAVAAYAFFLDYFVTTIRNRYIRSAYYSTILINVSFFTFIPAQTAILSYGCGIIPILALVCDRMIRARQPFTDLTRGITVRS